MSAFGSQERLTPIHMEGNKFGVPVTLCGITLSGQIIKTAHPNVWYDEQPAEVYRSHRVTNDIHAVTCAACQARAKQLAAQGVA